MAKESWPDRIKWLVETYYDGNWSKAGVTLAGSRETVRKWGKKATRTSVENLQTILRRHPDLSPEWLITGRPPRLKLPDVGDPRVDTARDIRARILELVDGIDGDYGTNGDTTAPEAPGGPPDPGPGPAGRGKDTDRTGEADD